MNKNLKHFLTELEDPKLKLGTSGQKVEDRLDKLPSSFDQAIQSVNKNDAPKILFLLATKIGGDKVSAKTALNTALKLATTEENKPSEPAAGNSAAPAAAPAAPSAAPVTPQAEVVSEASQRVKKFVSYLFE